MSSPLQNPQERYLLLQQLIQIAACHLAEYDRPAVEIVLPAHLAQVPAWRRRLVDDQRFRACVGQMAANTMALLDARAREAAEVAHFGEPNTGLLQ